MLFIYSIDLETLKVCLYDYCKDHETANELLKNVAVNFVRRECGERFAENAFQDNLTDSQVKNTLEDCYFLRNSDVKTNQIDMFKKKTSVLKGWVTNGVEVSVKKVLTFGVTEAALGLPIETTVTTTKPSFQTEKQAVIYGSMISELQERLKIRNCLQNNDPEFPELEKLPVLPKLKLPERPPVPPPCPVFNEYTGKFENSSSVSTPIDTLSPEQRMRRIVNMLHKEQCEENSDSNSDSDYDYIYSHSEEEDSDDEFSMV